MNNNIPEETQLYSQVATTTPSQAVLMLRFCKIMLVAAIGLNIGLIGFNNIVDYSSNFNFVTHIMQMDSIKETQQWRAVEMSFLHHPIYWTVIAWQLLVACLCLWGAYQCWRVRGQSAACFNQAKWFAVIGLTLNMLLWLVVFNVIGAEWFLMWQSQEWNVQNSAFRLFATSGIVLLILISAEREVNEP